MNYEEEIRREYIMSADKLAKIIMNECTGKCEIKQSETSTNFNITIDHFYWEVEYKFDNQQHSKIINQIKQKLNERTKESK